MTPSPGDREITATMDGERLDQLVARGAGLSRTRAKVLIEAGHVSAGAATIRDANHRVKQGQSFVVAIPEPEDAQPAAEPIALNVLYEDEDLLVIDKPAGLVVHPAPGHGGGTLVNALLAHCGASLSGIGGVRRPGIVHRLDKDTSGLMVVAKHDAAHADLSAQFASREAGRTYLAAVFGGPRAKAGTIDGAIGRDPKHRKKMTVVVRGGKPAQTSYRLVETYGPRSAPLASLLECTLATGRTHQVRVHLAHIGVPVIGDPVYARARAGRTRAFGAAAPAVAAFTRQALHAAKLRFRHPRTAETLTFTSELPSDFSGLISALETL
ncbi:MAG TPA: RluA family pseudouridine synthase [Alphaproteobacteria bacterium]|nr:RluA family pseudouridine synthase [Alphaproteobacteria bacterium]